MMQMINKILSFDIMITPIIVKVLFWIGVVVNVLVGLTLLVKGMGSTYGGGMLVIMGLSAIVLGPILTRIVCELLIVTFEIHKNLVDINRKTQE
jgi:hypothetical protein